MNGTYIRNIIEERQYLAHNLHTSQENRRKQEILFEKGILPLGLEIKRYGHEKKQNTNR